MRHLRLRWIARPFVIAAALFMPFIPAHAQAPLYRILDLGDLGGGGAAAKDIANSGHVTGQSAVPGGNQHAFLWVDGVMTDLGPLAGHSFADGRGVDNFGRVAGRSGTAPVRWDAGVPERLPTAVSADVGQASARNRRFLVGYRDELVLSSLVGKRAMRWHGQTVTPLGTLGGLMSEAYDINASDQIAGWANEPAGFTHMTLWGAGGAADLHGAFAAKTRSLAYSVNDLGVAVGTAFSTSIAVDGIPVIASAAGMAALPLPVGTPRGEAFGINKAGDVVGVLNPPGIAALWPGGATAVTLVSRLTNGAGWSLQIAYGINDRGEIAGVGTRSGQTRAFLLRPQPCDTNSFFRVALVDPAATAAPGAGFTAVDGRDVATDPEALASGGAPASGLVADGTCRLLVRCEVSSAGQVALSFAGADDGFDPPTGNAAFDGRLGLPGAAPGGGPVVASTAFVASAHRAFFVVHAPEAFPPGDDGVSSRELVLKLVFTGGDGCPITRFQPVRVERPPLVVMHGLWSNRDDAFGGCITGIRAQIAGLGVFGRDYPNAARFDDNRRQLPDVLEEVRALTRARGIAIAQADVCGHSMGGLLSRRWAATPSAKRPDNYGQGPVNRLITVDTPHCGSPIANAVWDFRAGLSPAKRVLMDIAFIELKMPVNYGAMEDLRVDSPAIQAIHALAFDTPAHAVYGNYTVPFTVCSFPFNLDFFDPQAFFCTSTQLGIPITGAIPTFSDLIVGVGSQRGGLSGDAVREFDHIHMGAANQPGVITHLAGLLRAAPSTSSSFAPGFPGGCFDSPPAPPPPPGDSAPEIGITSPAEGAAVSPGENLTLQATPVAGDAPVEMIYILAGHAAPAAPPDFEAMLQVPANAVGALQLVAMGRHPDGALSLAAVTLQVAPPAALDSLEADPPSLRFHLRGSAQRVRLTGHYTGGATRDLTSPATGTAYQTSNPSVATVDADGWVRAVTNGVASITASNGSRTVVYPVEVLLLAQARLELAAGVGALALIAGQRAGFGLNLLNQGPDAALPAQVLFRLPAAAELVPQVPPAGGMLGGGVSMRWTVASLAAGAATGAAPIQVLGVVPGTSTLSLEAVVPGGDPTEAGDALSIPVRVFASPEFRIEPAAGGLQAVLQTQAGVAYTLEISPDPDAVIWSAAGMVSGDGLEHTLPLPDPDPAPVLFARLRLSAEGVAGLPPGSPGLSPGGRR